MNTNDILYDNLKTALSSFGKYLLYGNGAAAFSLLVTVSSSESIALPFGLPEAQRNMAGLFALAVYFIAGCGAAITLPRAQRIIDKMRESPELLEAAVTYPSIPTTRIPAPRFIAALTPPVLIIITVLLEGASFDSVYFIVGLMVLISPYVTLAIELRHALGDNQSDGYGD